jgi:hypothetical protein
MESKDLRKKIDKAFKKEEKSKKLQNFLRKSFKDAEVETTEQFIKGYIRQVPDILDIVYSAASSSRVLNLMQPVFNTVFSYWNETYDVIPDNEGLIGLTDDAYLSLSLMQKIADTKIPGSKNKLIKINLENENKKMRVLFGEKVAAILDRIVSEVFTSVQFQINMNSLLANPLMALGLQGFNMQEMNAVNPNYLNYQQHMREFDQLQQMKHDVFTGQLGAMAANAGISWP